MAETTRISVKTRKTQGGKGIRPHIEPRSRGGHFAQEMTSRSKANRIHKTNERLTPYDVATYGTMAQKPKEEKAPPRPQTKEEMHANNVSMTEFGEKLMDMKKWVPIFRSELKAANSGKVGRPFTFSDTLIFWIMSFMTTCNISFRLAAGMVTPLLKEHGLPAPSYSRLCERSLEIAEGYMTRILEQERGILSIVVCDNVVERIRRVGIDSSGMNLSDVTLWKNKKWRTSTKNRGWLKLHALSDVDSGEIIAYVITTEKVGDAPLLKTLVSSAMNAGHMFECVFADGAYGSNENWKFLCQEHSLKFITSFKSNTSPTNNGCVARGKAATLWCQLPYAEWVKVSGYSVRWKCEVVFSDLKRIFKEAIKAHSMRGAVMEIATKISKFNEYKAIRAQIMGTTGNGICLA